MSSEPWLDVPWKQFHACALWRVSLSRCGLSTERAACRLRLPLGRAWQGPSGCMGLTPGFLALCRLQVYLEGNTFRAAPAPPIHPSILDVQPWPRPPPDTQSLTCPVSLTSWESFYTSTLRPVSASRPTKERNSILKAGQSHWVSNLFSGRTVSLGGWGGDGHNKDKGNGEDGAAQ